MSTSSLPDAAARTRRLLDCLNLTPSTEPDTYTGTNIRHLAPRVFGGQVLAQGLVAAGRTVPHGRTPHSLHGYFLRPGDLGLPITFAVDRLRDGRSFSARRVQALQDGVPILSMIASFESPASGPEHADPMPDVPAPDDLPSLHDRYGDSPHPGARYWAYEQAMDLRFVRPPIFERPERPPGDRLQAWWRVSDELPPDPLLHAAVVTFTSDYGVLEPVMRRHGRSWLDLDWSVASIDHAMWFHGPVRADDWILYEATSPAAGNSRGLCQGRMFAADGRLVVSVAQEGLFRARD